MKTIILLLSVVFVSCVTSGVKPRAVANEGCNISNYLLFIKKPGWHQCYLKDADLSRKYLRDANLKGAYLAGADLSFANLIGADLSGAVLTGANFRGAYLLFADITQAVFFNTDLTDAKVTKGQAEYLKKQGVSGFVIVDDDSDS